VSSRRVKVFLMGIKHLHYNHFYTPHYYTLKVRKRYQCSLPCPINAGIVCSNVRTTPTCITSKEHRLCQQSQATRCICRQRKNKKCWKTPPGQGLPPSAITSALSPASRPARSSASKPRKSKNALRQRAYCATEETNRENQEKKQHCSRT